jgi:hypothetical protein
MPKSKQVSWAQLRVGLLVIVAITIFGVLIFLMTGQGFFQRKYTLFVFTDSAGGLRVGDPVRLAGIDAGNVRHISISESHDPNRAVRIEMHLQRHYQTEIRLDSVATMAAEAALKSWYAEPHSPLRVLRLERRSRCGGVSAQRGGSARHVARDIEVHGPRGRACVPGRDGRLRVPKG